MTVTTRTGLAAGRSATLATLGGIAGLCVAAACAALDLPAAAAGLALLAFGGVAIPVTAAAPARAPYGGIGWANGVTLLRALIAALLLGALPFDAFLNDHGWWLFGLALTALLLDGVDGWLARRFDTESDFGGRLDMEVDAAFMLLLCVLLWRLEQTGAWIFAIGGMRYAFAAAGWWLPRLRRPLPPSLRRRVICAVQVAALATALAPVITPALATAICATALALLTASFARDIQWLLTVPEQPAHSTRTRR